MVTLTRSLNQHFGLRPMEPLKDLGAVANLIEEAFAHDLDSAGQNALRELRWLARLKPVLWWMLTFNPEHSDFLSGFVWEEDGKVVGNITVNQTPPGGRRWLISNVAVSVPYRGQGIARGLMYAGLELVKEYRGTSVVLQVREDNEPARHLYESLKFKAIASTTYLHLDRVPRLERVDFPAEVIFRARRFNEHESRLAYNLAGIAAAPVVQKEWPVRQSRFRLDFSDHITTLFYELAGGPASAYWVVESERRFVGLINIYAGLWGRPHYLELLVHPDWRGQLERPLISRALGYLYPWRKRGIKVKHSGEHIEAVEAFKSFGFDEEQTLIWMKLDL